MLRRHARRGSTAAFPLVEALASMGNHPTAQLAALEALGETPVQAAADLADRWSGESAPKALRKAARRALLRLSQHGIQPTPPPAAAADGEAAARSERIRRALMTAVNGEGTRLLYLLIDVPFTGAQLVMAVSSQTHGLTRFDSAESSARRFKRFVEADAQRFGFALAEIPPAYARHLLSEAAAVSRAARDGLPQRYHSLRDLLAPTPDDPAAAVSPVFGLPDADAVRYRPEPVEASIELLDRPEFADWVPPAERVLPLARAWEEAEGGTLALPPSAVAQRREATMDQLVELVLGRGGADGFRRRLEDNAYLLLRNGNGREGRRALTAALALDPPDLATAKAHPLVRSLAAQALDAARTALAERGESPASGSATPPTLGASVAAGTPARGESADAVTTPSGLILPR